MEIPDLKAFVSIVDTGSFSRAAEEIHLSQPAISKRISRLENGLGQRLFDRIGHRNQLTEAGRTLLPHAIEILRKVEDTQRDIDALSGQPTGILRIATSYHIGLHRLPPILKGYYADYPNIELDLQFEDSEVALEQVRENQIELAMVTLPAELPDTLQGHPIWDDPMVIVCAHNSPISRVGSVAQLLEFPAILPEHNTITRELIERAFMTDAELHVRLSSNHLESIRMMVEIGLGWSVLPVTMKTPQLDTLSFADIRISRRLGVITHRQRTLSLAASRLLDRLRAIAHADQRNDQGH